MTRGIYDPQLVPERTILAEKEALLQEIRNTTGLVCKRSGEQYFLGCLCREYQVTGDYDIAAAFFDDHSGHLL